MNFDRQEQLKKEREERLSQAAAKKRKLLEIFEAMELHVMHDHTYAAKPVDLNATGEDLKHPAVNQHLVRLLYNNHVHINATEIKDLETCRLTVTKASNYSIYDERGMP